jgi:hypothetical protein
MRKVLSFLISLLMVFTLILPNANVVQAEEDVYTILAASDFQAMGSSWQAANATAKANMNAIVQQVVQHHDVDAFLFGGDYSSVSHSDAYYCMQGYNELLDVLNKNGLGNTKKFFVKGNHDRVALDFEMPTGGYEEDAFAVYIINEADYMSEMQDEATVRATAAKLRSWLNAQTVGEKPIFVITHVPLNYSTRSRIKGDAQYAQYLVDVLNEAGERGLNIVFLYGHNHSTYSDYMGGTTNFIAKGEKMWVSDTAGVARAPHQETIHFTYMNAGYSCLYNTSSGDSTSAVDTAFTMSVFQIRGDDVTISRYDAKGLHALQQSQGRFNNSDHTSLGYTPDTSTCASPYTVYGTVEGEVIHSGEVYYKLVDQLSAGKQYIFADSQTEGTAKALMTNTSGTALTDTQVNIISYNGEKSHIRHPEDTTGKLWVFENVNANGYGNLRNLSRSGYLAVKGFANGDDHGKPQLLKSSNSPQSMLWSYTAGNGVFSDQTDLGFIIRLTQFYDARTVNVVDEWRVVGHRYDPNFYHRLYAYEQTPLTYTYTMSEKVGDVAVGERGEVGSVIVKTWSSGQVEYIPVTMDMLSVDASTAGVYTNVRVVMDGHVLVCDDYTLNVGTARIIPVEAGYYYRLTDEFVASEGLRYQNNNTYLILDRNAPGAGVMMISQGICDKNVIPADILVVSDADGVPCVRSDALLTDTKIRFQEWMYHYHSDGTFYLMQPNLGDSNVGYNNNLRVAAPGGAILVTGSPDAYSMKNPMMRNSSSLGNYTTVNASVDVAQCTMYIQYNAALRQFQGVTTANRVQGSEVYIFERVPYDTATAVVLGTNGNVKAGSAVIAQTGTEILIIYPDGTEDRVSVTADMLYKNGRVLTADDLKYSATIADLTLQYNGVVLANNFVLVITP